jgi:hypothetical protein
MRTCSAALLLLLLGAAQCAAVEAPARFATPHAPAPARRTLRAAVPRLKLPNWGAALSMLQLAPPSQYATSALAEAAARRAQASAGEGAAEAAPLGVRPGVGMFPEDGELASEPEAELPPPSAAEDAAAKSVADESAAGAPTNVATGDTSATAAALNTTAPAQDGGSAAADALVAHAAEAAAVAALRCAPDCTRNGGNCDAERGGCDCPLGRTGDACRHGGSSFRLAHAATRGSLCSQLLARRRRCRPASWSPAT